MLQYVKDRRKLTDDEKHSILRIEKHRASVDFQYPKTNGRRFNPQLACSRRSDSGVRAKKKASERTGKKRGKTGEEDVVFSSLPSFFPALSFALFFARAPLSERLEQANPQWEEKFNWLCYSPSVDGCFCICCLVFAPESTRNMELISMPFRAWKNAVGSQRGTLPKHVNSDIYRDALTKAEQFLAICDNKRLSVASQVSAAYSESVERNRAILLSNIDVIISLAVRGIPLRGNWNSMEQREDGNFDYFIQWKSRFDTILKSHWIPRREMRVICLRIFKMN